MKYRVNASPSWALFWVVLVCWLGVPEATAWSATLRWTAPSDALSLDPHAQNDVLSNSLNAHIYERLTARDENLALIPGLAMGWKQVNALTWHFQLRTGVQFQDGSALTGDDVVFSIQRAQHPTSSIAQYARGLGTPRHLGHGLIELKLQRPNPVLLDHVDAVPIMSRDWSRVHGVMSPLSIKNHEESYAKHHAMGTGPYVLTSRQPDSLTVMNRFEGYWNRIAGNVDRLEFIPIANPLTRTAALVKGEVDLVTAPAATDLNRLKATPGVLLRSTMENRVVFLGFDQQRDELLYSNVKGKNPLKDVRVRMAISHAIDRDAIRSVVLRNQGTATACMLPSPLTCQTIPELEARSPAFDPARSRQLLKDAGYPQGFAFTLDCPNDRNVNDEALCVAMAGMLAKVGIDLRINTMPRSQFYPKLDRFETSAYLMAWGGAELDAQPTMDPLMHSYDASTGLGDVNFGRFSDPGLDALIEASAIEVNPVKRTEMIRKAVLRHQSQAYNVVLYRQALTWAMREGVDAAPVGNNHVRAWLVKVAR